MADPLVDYDSLKVRVISKAEDREFARDLMTRHHYLGDAVMRCKHLMYLATYGEQWVGLFYVTEATLRLSLRDKELFGWSKEQKQERLKYVGNNKRFLILPGWEKLNFSSKILSLVCRRISNDWLKEYKQPLLILETFVDPQRYRGSCYAADNWQHVGQSKGINKIDEETGEYYKTHAKHYFIKELNPESIKALSSSSSYTHPLLTGRQQVKKESSDNEKYLNPNDLNLKNLKEEFSQLQDDRISKGKMYDQPSILALCVASILAGKNNYYQMHEWMKGIGKELRKQAGINYGRCPSMSSIRRIVQSVDNQVLSNIVTKWLRGDSKTKHLIFDGKAVRSAGGKKATPQFLNFLDGETGVLVAQQEVDCKTNEVPVARRLLDRMSIKDVIITADALHTCINTARIIEERGGKFVFVVKENQKYLLEQILNMPRNAFDKEPYIEIEKQSGIITERKIHTAQTNIADFKFPFVRQVAFINKTVEKVSEKEVFTETVYIISNLTKLEADPKKLLQINRNHWSIENKLHYVKDYTIGEDSSRIRNNNSIANMVLMFSAAVSIFRILNVSSVPSAITFCQLNPALACKIVGI